MNNIYLNMHVKRHFSAARVRANVGAGKTGLFAFIVLFLTGCSATNPPDMSDGHLMTEKISTSEIPQAVSKTPFLPPPKPAPKQEIYTVVVNDVPVKDLLFALARDAKLNVDIHPKVKGKTTLNAINQTLPQILNRISEQVDLRFRIEGPNLVISPDTPYVRTYEINYMNMKRSSKSEVSVATQISTTGASGVGNNSSGGGSGGSSGGGSGSSGGAGGRGNNSKTMVTNESVNDFWVTTADNIKLLLNDNGESQENDNRVVVSPMGGVISVLATEREHVRIQSFLDKVMASVQRQVLIEATIVEVQLNDTYQSGVDWARLSDNNGTGSNGPSFRSLMTDGNYDTPPVFSITYSNVARNIFAAVKLLETFGEAKVLSSPKIMALNNQAALLKVVDETVYFTIEQEFVDGTINSAARQTFTSEIHTVPVGLIMSVTPQINANDSVTMNIRPTISRIIGFKTDPAPRLAGSDFDNLIPEIQVREMESILQVNSGQTVVLGGLMQNVKSKDKQGVPFFSDIPIIGNLFNSREDKITKSELVIFLRPTVIHKASLDGDFKNFRQYLPELEELSKIGTGRQQDIVRNDVN